MGINAYKILVLQHEKEGARGGLCTAQVQFPMVSLEYFIDIISLKQKMEPQLPGTLRACPGLYRDCFTSFNPKEKDYFKTYTLENNINVNIGQ